MSVINPNETAKKLAGRASGSCACSCTSAASKGIRPSSPARASADFPLALNIVPVSDWIEPGRISGAAAAIVQVDADSPASIKRFQKLAKAVATPLIAAAYDPPLALVRSLIRAGAHDVIPLPLSIEELEASLAPIRDELAKRRQRARAATGKLVTVIKSVGGVGATALAHPARDALRARAKRAAAAKPASSISTCSSAMSPSSSDCAEAVGARPARSRRAARRRPAARDDHRAFRAASRSSPRRPR